VALYRSQRVAGLWGAAQLLGVSRNLTIPRTSDLGLRYWAGLQTPAGMLCNGAVKVSIPMNKLLGYDIGIEDTSYSSSR
jgi:hypothetical protein